MVIFREEAKQTKTLETLSWNKADNVGYDFGFAVDIGTTTIAMSALDLRKGRLLGESACTNRQTALGADVMMRIMHCMQGRGARLHHLVAEQVEEMAEGLLQKKKIEFRPERCLFFVVGNTTMCHIFLGKSVTGLAGYPFQPSYTGNYRCLGVEIGMEKFAGAEICVLSGIAAHVGSDALAVVGAEKLYGNQGVQLALDLGTNAEIILNNKGSVYVCSTAAGPAFEGKGISCGMSAKAGAVSGVTISSGNGNLILRVLEGATAKGLCSSGLIDALAQLRKCRLLLEDGILLNRNEAQSSGICEALCDRLVSREGERAFLICRKEEAGRELYLKQSDIRNLQLAKGAIRAGAESLLSVTGLTVEDIDELVVAGVLGSCVRPASSIAIGLFPSAAAAYLRFAGNAAGKGAVDGILEADFAEKMEQLAKEITHIELAQHTQFQQQLMMSMDFKEWI